MGKYTLEFSKKAAKQYHRLPQEYKTLVDAALSRLMDGQLTDMKPVEAQKDVYRMRVGKYRILFLKRVQTIVIARIGTRGGVYK